MTIRTIEFGNGRIVSIYVIVYLFQTSKNGIVRGGCSINYQVQYEGRDLEVLSQMPRYYAWIMSIFRPHIGERTIEFGAGIGSISERILPHVETLQLVEPSPTLAANLHRRFSGNGNVTVSAETLEIYITGQENDNNDTAVLVNVLEHIENDKQAIRGVRAQLRDGGKLLLFVPATPFLFSKLDARFGHYRRYVLSDLRTLIEQNGFRIHRVHYMDILGMVPWWIVNTIGGQTDFNPFVVGLYDKIGIPLTQFFEGIVRPPIGKNIILVAEKCNLPINFPNTVKIEP